MILLESQSTISEYSRFDKYKIKDSLTIKLPAHTLSFTNVTGNKYRYTVDSDSNSKLITSEVTPLEIELAPTLPTNLPSKKSDYVMLQFQDKIFVDANSESNVYVQFPLEIGLFVVGSDGSKRLLDCFTFDPENSRFGLYGNPSEGVFCNYADVKTESTEKLAPKPFQYGILKISIKNTLDRELLLDQVVFLATNHDMYYNNTNAHVDDLSVIITRDAGNNVFAKLSSISVEPQNDWNLSPRLKDKTETPFIMREGFT